MATCEICDQDVKGNDRDKEAGVVVIESSPKLLGSCRLTIVILSFFAIFQILIQRFNLSMALVCMTENSTTSTAEFNWDKGVQTSTLAAFFYGYLSTQLMAGMISDKYGGKAGILGGVLLLSASTLAIPESARFDPRMVFLIRVFQGAVSGFAFPSVYGLIGDWTSPTERATLSTLVFAGVPIACLVNYPLASFLCQSGIDGGWPMVFYVPGFIGFVWCLICYFVVYSNPSQHPRISAEEKNFLLNSNRTISGKVSWKNVPWGSILKSAPVHSLWISHFSCAWSFYLIAISLPLFTSEVYHYSLTMNGFLSALPHLGSILFMPTAKLFDYLRHSDRFSLTALRKIFNTIGLIGPMMAQLSPLYLPKEAVVWCLALGRTLQELAITGGFFFSHKDLVGKYSSILFGITNTLAQIPGFLVPLLIAWITPNVRKKLISTALVTC